MPCQEPHHRHFQGFPLVLRVDRVAHAPLHLRRHRLHQSRGLPGLVRPGRDAQMHLAYLGVGGQGRVGLAVDEIDQLILHLTLPVAADL